MNRQLPIPRPHAEALASSPGWPSFFAAGFVCSTHRRRSGQRLDLIAATATEKFAHLDYVRLKSQESTWRGEGLRCIVRNPARALDFSSVLSIVSGGSGHRHPGHLDLCHSAGDHLDLFKPDFVSALAGYGAALPAGWPMKPEARPFLCP